MVRLKQGVGARLRGAQLSDVSISATHTYETVQISGGTTTPSTVADANYNAYTAATYHREGYVQVQGSVSSEIINLNPNVGTIGANGLVTRLSSGLLRVLVKTKLLTLPLTLDLRNKSDEADQPKVFQSTVAGSLAEHCQQQIDSRINGTMTMAANGKVYTTQDHAAPNYVRNPNVWCADVDLTCICPWNTSTGVVKAGTLITPRHMVNAAHYELGVGVGVRFIANDNTIHYRTIVSKVRHPDYKPYSPDLTVYTLSSDLPAAISPCKLMPANAGDYLVENSVTRPPGLGLDQEEKALIIDFAGGGFFRVPTDSDRLLFHESKIVGDSGNPAFLIVNGELVLVTVWTYGGAGSGTPVSAHIDTLNAMLVTADAQAGVSTGYTVTEADFSAFPSYA